MGLYNSIATLTNNTNLVVEIGAVTLAPAQTICFWNTKNYPDSIANSIFTSLKIASDVLTESVTSGNVSVVYDGYNLPSSSFGTLLADMIVAFDRINNAPSALANGISINEHKDARGNIIFVPEKRVGDELSATTHNFADKTTWFSQSYYALNQPGKDSGDGLTWSFPHNRIIDLVHGKVLNEDTITSSIGHGYKLRVYVDGIEVKEYSIFNPDSDGYDFIADYKNGTITFTQSKSGSTITAHYAYADGPYWILAPKDGQIINIESAEVQFSKDIDMNDAIEYEIWAYNPQDLPNKICVHKMSYKSVQNFIDDARGCYPSISSIGGTLGTKVETVGFPFNYSTLRQLESSLGVELRVKTKNGREFGGSCATATFYCTVETE